MLAVLSVPTLDDAISISNENSYGNIMAIFTTPGGATSKYQYEIEAGQVGINTPVPIPLPYFCLQGTRHRFEAMSISMASLKFTSLPS